MRNDNQLETFLKILLLLPILQQLAVNVVSLERILEKLGIDSNVLTRVKMIREQTLQLIEDLKQLLSTSD